MCLPPFFTIPKIAQTPGFAAIIILIIVFIIIGWLGKEGKYALEQTDRKFNRPLRYATYYAILIAIFWFGGNEKQFIYFQF